MSPEEPVAQPVEHLTFNQGVPGSNPGGLTKFPNKYNQLRTSEDWPYANHFSGHHLVNKSETSTVSTHGQAPRSIQLTDQDSDL
jgi:hypothetical protein